MKIKEFTYCPLYGCYGMIEQMNHYTFTFTKNNAKYSIIPLETPHIMNSRIDFSFDPSYIPHLALDSNEYLQDFNDIVSAIMQLQLDDSEAIRICDAMPASITILFDDGSEKIVYAFSDDFENKLRKFIEKYMPMAFQKFYIPID